MNLLTIFTPSKTQTQVLAILLMAVNPVVGTQSISSESMATARDILIKLKILEYVENVVSITELGMELCMDNNLIDTSNQPTEFCKKLITSPNVVASTTEAFNTLKSLL